MNPYQNCSASNAKSYGSKFGHGFGGGFDVGSDLGSDGAAPVYSRWLVLP